MAFKILVLGCLFANCHNDDSSHYGGHSVGGLSILVTNGNVLVSGYGSELDGTKYWINGESADRSAFTALVEDHSTYRLAVDGQYRTGHDVKDADGNLQTYRFQQGDPMNDKELFYFKDGAKTETDIDSVGRITTLALHGGLPYFAGHLLKIVSPETNDVVRPLTPFVWDGDQGLTKLELPEPATAFKGIGALYMQGPTESYVSGLCGFPMYWQNADPVVLDQRYGEVWQITKAGPDLYAVGLVNKYNSNSTGHTACYWKNGELFELEDRAQAYGIFVDGDDIYVTGSVGNTPAQYRPCYWKNGVRVDLPMP